MKDSKVKGYVEAHEDALTAILMTLQDIIAEVKKMKKVLIDATKRLDEQEDEKA